MRLAKQFLLGCLFLYSFSTLSVYGSKTSTTSSGDWTDASNWDNGVPTCGDTVIISPGHTILIQTSVNLDEGSTPACSTAMYIEISGILGFKTGKKLYIPHYGIPF